MATTHTATYTEDGRIYIDDYGDTGTYDADGGEWRGPVEDILRQHGYEPVGEWTLGEHSYDPVTIQVTDRDSEKPAPNRVTGYVWLEEGYIHTGTAAQFGADIEHAHYTGFVCTSLYAARDGDPKLVECTTLPGTPSVSDAGYISTPFVIVVAETGEELDTVWVTVDGRA